MFAVCSASLSLLRRFFGLFCVKFSDFERFGLLNLVTVKRLLQAILQGTPVSLTLGTTVQKMKLSQAMNANHTTFPMKFHRKGS